MSKIDEAYCITTKETITANDLLRIELSNPTRYAIQFQSNLLCPSCRKASVTLVHKARPFFRTFPNAMHSDDCDLAQDEMSREETLSFIHDQPDQEEISRQINRLFGRLLCDAAGEGNYSVTHSVESTPSAAQRQSGRKRKYISQRNITSQLENDDIDIYKLFYGRVKIKWEDDQKGEGKRLLLWDPKKKRMICRIWVNKKVLAHLHPSIYRNTNDLCCVVFLGKLMTVKDRGYYHCVLERSDYLKIAPMQYNLTKKTQ